MAAGRELQGTKSRKILSQLIDRVGELSDALDAQEYSNNQIRSRREQNEDTETEIRRAFGRSKSQFQFKYFHRFSSCAVWTASHSATKPKFSAFVFNENELFQSAYE